MRVVIIGGGIAGVSIGYELADDFDVTLLEAESSLAMHTTGRSAATWIGSYGPEQVRYWSHESLPWLLDPPIAVDGPLATDMSCLWVAPAGDEQALRDMVHETHIEILSVPEACEFNPVLRPEAFALAAVDHEAKDLDVAGLHHAYTRALRARGGRVEVNARVTSATCAQNVWTITTERGDNYRADLVINAAGAWGDVVGSIFGARLQGLKPRRRTIFISPTEADLRGIPFTIEYNGSFYFKREGDAVLCSPQDATDHAPGDPRPDQLEIARTIEEINEMTTLNLRSVRTSWAGLRTFMPDGEPHVGLDERADAFFWFVGQGGYGIQMAPALARHGAAEVRKSTP
jgi:D-arginine dehydrogenase